MDNKKKVIIDDVAKLAGVSKATISRYLNGKFEYMSEKTKDRIKEAIKELNYRPNNIARSLKSNKSRLIGVVIADLTNPFSSIIIKGIGDECKARGYNMVIANSDNDAKEEAEYIKSLLDQRVEGIIVNSTGHNEELIVSMKERGIPISMLDRTFCEDKIDSVKSNNYEITVETINYLIDAGFNSLCFFTERLNNVKPRIERERAFLDVCSKRLKKENYNISVIDHNEGGNIEVNIYKFLNNYSGKKAIFAVNGVVLLNTLSAINKLNINVPKDLGVCGYDNWGWASLIPPGITTISQPSYEMGFEAAKILIDRIEEKLPKDAVSRVLNSKLEIRGSTIPLNN
ncbi:LacI family DNA-binding transcriptional regulator [Clostridium felsineum]|uniref:HTH-type transcriptional regulator KdgR n=1 Tax=Clostridium felsineum TaxID=36839 RepID=A0A1S8L9V6_9CLOT|nr:LacI family DNA-binding transcriptional regulator [Clostridium felsineum]URZ02290.1 HTH-type transcriptional regulator KdgR [Clostridium felsineum]URZ04960.1 HTH-type transcriptional regulator KdgR [Clostridium felsineum]URZ10001.1 HTH-type transcriptional regulator KdgR [Clostridium felsineum]URZ18101.1 HTH-type transcriptional regulator KdgR [Clostridium felsineum DSM 794]